MNVLLEIILVATFVSIEMEVMSVIVVMDLLKLIISPVAVSSWSNTFYSRE